MKKGKKFIALFLVFSLLIINCATLSRLEEKREKRKKHGANLIIQKINGQQVRGELITVKPSSLLLLNTEGKDVSVDIEEIKVITVVKKSQALLGVGTGLLGGAGSGAAIGASLWVLGLPVMAIFGEAGIESWKDDFPDLLWGGVLIGAGIGLLLGVSSGAASGIDKTIQIEGMSDLEIKEAMDYLRKKARIRDYK
jgi:hypothetical protein